MTTRPLYRSSRFSRLREGLCRGPAMAGVFIALLIQGGAASAQEFRGQAKVVSGNEIVVGKRSARLFGMIAPGLDELCEINEAKIKCGVVAWAELIKLADGQHVSCDVEPAASAKEKLENEKEKPRPTAAKAAKHKTEKAKSPRTSSGGTLATCYVGETDLNEALVRSGWAKAIPEETDRYVVDESDAKESRRGLWTNVKKRARRKKK